MANRAVVGSAVVACCRKSQIKTVRVQKYHWQTSSQSSQVNRLRGPVMLWAWHKDRLTFQNIHLSVCEKIYKATVEQAQQWLTLYFWVWWKENYGKKQKIGTKGGVTKF